MKKSKGYKSMMHETIIRYSVMVSCIMASFTGYPLEDDFIMASFTAYPLEDDFITASFIAYPLKDAETNYFNIWNQVLK